jgi:hypothetical protein
MPSDDDKSTMAERLTGRHDPKDPDGLLTVEQAQNPPDPAAYGTDGGTDDAQPGDDAGSSEWSRHGR